MILAPLFFSVENVKTSLFGGSGGASRRKNLVKNIFASHHNSLHYCQMHSWHLRGKSKTTKALIAACFFLFTRAFYLEESETKMINYTSLASTAFQMPKIGLGTFGLAPSEAKATINEALSLGYRLFDCAPVYFNEMEVGDAFHESISGVPRTDCFITSKLASPFHRPEHVEPALRKTLADLRLGYLDLFLIHWPVVSLGSLSSILCECSISSSFC